MGILLLSVTITVTAAGSGLAQVPPKERDKPLTVTIEGPGTLVRQIDTKEGKKDASDVVTIAVTPEAMQLLNSWGDRLFFFTPAKNPIRSTKDLNSPATMGSWNMMLHEKLIEFARAVGVVEAGVVAVGTSNEVFGPATENSNIRLFVLEGPNEAAQIKAGLQVRFVAEKDTSRP